MTDAHAPIGEMIDLAGDTVERSLAAAREAGIDTVIGWGCDCVVGVDWRQWLAGGATNDLPGDVVPRPNLLCTSGTTGRPKGTELPPTMFAGGVDMEEHLDRLAKGTFFGFGTHQLAGGGSPTPAPSARST